MSLQDLHIKLQRLHGKSYGTYNDLRNRTWHAGDFAWDFVHVQGDPYAPPSRLKVTVPLVSLGFPTEWYDTPVRRLGLVDFLLRRLVLALAGHDASVGTGNGGTLQVAIPGPEILARNTCRLEGDHLVALVQVGLPGDGRRIEAEWAIGILCQTLPDALTEAFYSINFKAKDCELFLRNLEIQEALREALPERGLVAFVGEGAILPRASGTSQEPLRGAKAFRIPPEMRVEIDVLGERLVGMGIPRGLTAIAGGGFQGKSTLLRALELAVYNHVPGDGRERVVCDATAFKVRAEEGRQVMGTCIEPMVRRLPGGKDTRSFQTTNASGSTSQASNLMEAIGLGAKTLLIDEDVSAVNFLIRDARMRQLIRSGQEPLIPLVDRIEELRDQLRLNVILVVGACGDFLPLCNQVIVMEEWQPRVATAEAKALSRPTAETDQAPFPNWPKVWTHSLESVRTHLKPGLRPSNAVEKAIKVKATPQKVQLGKLEAQVHLLDQIVCVEQWRFAGAGALAMLMGKQTGILEEAVWKGAAHWSQPDGLDLAEVRPLEFGAMMLRLAEMG